MKQRTSGGFTLLEILVALTIFSIMTTLAYGGMEHVFDSRESIDLKTEHIQKLQMLFSILTNDLEQTVNRPVRDRLGNMLPAFESKPGDDVKLAFTTQVRSYWQLKNTVSTLQRIEYRVEEDKLVRYFWPVLDRAHNSEPESTILLEDIEHIKFEFINQFAYEYWPLPKGHDDFDILPSAVRIKFSRIDENELERWFLLRSL